MKKIVMTILVFALFLFIGFEKVEAIYNGGGGGGTTINGGECSYDGCLWDNPSFKIVRLKLIYYDGTEASLEKPITGKHKYFYLLQEGGKYNGLDMFSNTSWIIPAGIIYNGNYNNNKSIEHFLLDNDSQNLKEIIRLMGIDINSLSKRCDTGIGYKNIGYRVIIEPLIMTYVGKENHLMTVKEWAGISGAGTNPQVSQVSWYLHTDLDDIGIKAYPNPTSNISDIKSPRTGYGYNIIDACGATKQCYKLTVTGTNPKCINTNKQNKGHYAEEFVSTDCEDDKKNVVENATSYGRLVKTINKDCKIYCKEEVEVAYPGNVLPAIPLGGNFVWPTFNKAGAYNKNNVHNLNITGKRVCTVVGNNCGTSKVTVKDLYNDFKSSITLKYNQENYKDNIKLDKAENNSICDGCENLTDKKKINVVRNISLKLPDKTYRYVNKQTKIASHTMSLDSTKYTDIGYGNLPIANTAKTDRNYSLEFTNISLGANGVFSKLASESTYKCTYRAKNTQNSCICPPGTTSAGKDLWCKIAKGEDINCPTAQMQYCNTNFGADDDTCPSKYCTNNPEISLETCVTAGNSYEACEAKLCSGGKKYECPENTPNEFMDISWCVENGIAKGQSEEEAIKICQDVVCPANGIPIIYRTIDLRNPFPSKKLNGGIKGFNTDDISGRYPGANWNSKKLVEVEIRNNRGVEDEEVYKKEPLYKFVLDAKTIRTVRKYNKDQKRGAGYSDFTLSCEGTTKNEKGEIIKDGSKCFSYTFLRGTVKSALTGGTCASANANTFDSCAR